MAGAAFQAEAQHIAGACQCSLRSMLDDLVRKAGDDTVDIAKIMDRPDKLTESQLNSIKEKWRSSEAKALFQADQHYQQLRSAFICLKSCGIDDGIASEIEGYHDHHYKSVMKVIAILGLAQASYKTLKQGESRADLIAATLERIRGDKIKLSEGILGQAQRAAK